MASKNLSVAKKDIGTAVWVLVLLLLRKCCQPVHLHVSPTRLGESEKFSRGISVGRWTDGMKWSPLTKREQRKEKIGNNNGVCLAHKCFVSNCKWNDGRIGGGNADTAYGYAWICAIGR